MDALQYEQLDDIATSEAQEYLTEKGYNDIRFPHQMDALLVDVVGDWLDKKMSFLALGRIFEFFEAEPMHHHMKDKDLVYEGVEVAYYFSQGDQEELKRIQNVLEQWYQNI